MNRRDILTGSAALSALAITGLAVPAQTGKVPSTSQLPATPKPAFTGLNGRPPASERRFRSPVIERTIDEMRTLCASPELFRLFHNCFPNTLDTTVFPGTHDGHPDTYVITGDIDAMWLRDSAAQLWPYLPFARQDPALQSLIEGAVRRQARLILLDPYANAFNRETSQPPLSWAVHDQTTMLPGVAERKWEIDSLCHTVRLAHGFWKQTGSPSPFDATWLQAAHRIVDTFRQQQRTSSLGPYHFQRTAAAPTDSLPMGGFGSPVRPNGLIASGFRPSDDACTYPFFVPANLFAITTLHRLAEIAGTVYRDAAFANTCTTFADEVNHAISTQATFRHPRHGEILAYELDGYGNTLAMDDANAPGLLSLTYLNPAQHANPLYARTRAFALSPDNPYFYRGTAAEGIGGPHIGRDFIWPMAIILRALTSTDDAEITTCLRTLCHTTADTGFMHEAFQKDDPANYTRPWFAWANGLFGELLLQLRTTRPTLLRNFRMDA